MISKLSQTNIIIILCLVLFALMALLNFLKVPLDVIAVSFVALGVFAVAFFKTDIALCILIFSMLLSPELKIGEAQARAVVLRLDDILLFVVFFAWFGKMAINKELGLLKFTPLNSLILSYVVVCVIATALGILIGGINPLTSFFYILKYIEYFLLYFLFVNNIRDVVQIKRFIIIFFITGFIVCICGMFQIGALERVTAPFEGKPEPNTLGGYLVILFSIAMGLFLYSGSGRWKFFSAALACSSLAVLIFTLSRTSYVAFLASYTVFLFFAKKKRLILIAALFAVIAGGAIVVPKTIQVVTQRVKRTFGYERGPSKTFEYMGRKITLEDSAAARVESWKNVLSKMSKRPFLGHGVTGVGLVDSQYPRILGETGIIGFFIFLWIIRTIFRNSYSSFLRMQEPWCKGLCLGFFACFVGMLIHCFGANTFIIVRIMEPFWFLAAIVFMLPRLGTVSE